MSWSIGKSKYIGGGKLFHFEICVLYHYQIGIIIHEWGIRFMLLYWHLCWHRNIEKRVKERKV
jgi:hypothetical protein